MMGKVDTYIEADVQVVVDGEVGAHPTPHLDRLARLKVDHDRIRRHFDVHVEVRRAHWPLAHAYW